jgi:hypothetical protein
MIPIKAILEGLAAIPKLIEKIEDVVERFEAQRKAEWRKQSIKVERALDEARSPTEIEDAVRQLHNLIRSG